MTEVDFHFNMPDKVGYACRLLRKAVAARGACVVVVGESPMLDAVDGALWSFAPSEFIAHCRIGAGPSLLARSPVVLSEEGEGEMPHRQVMLNLGTRLPRGFERFERLIEFVATDDADRVEGRKRWRHYADRGYAIRRHDYAGS